MRLGWVVGGMVAVGLACTSSGSVPDAPILKSPPAPALVRGSGAPVNFLIIVADDLGTDKVGVYAEHPNPPRTPRIDALAAEGVWFRNAYVYPTCSASRAALLTGRYGRRNGMGGIVELDGPSDYELPLSEVLLPEALERGGADWAATAIGKWHLSGFRTPTAFRHPLRQGFDHHVGALGNLVLTSRDYGQRGNFSHYEKSTDGEPAWTTKYATVDTTDDAIAALHGLRDPFLLWVAYNAPHEPFHAPPGADVRNDAPPAALHRAMVETLDREVGRLLDALTPEQRRTTQVVFLGDNGTAHEAIEAPLPDDHGKGTLFEGGTGVPWIVAGAGVTARGESAALVHAVDLLPTVLEQAGVSSDGLVLDGVSFAALLADPKGKGARQTVFTERFNPVGPGPYDVDMVAIRDERYKLLRNKAGVYKLYDLQGRNDDGKGASLDTLQGPEKARAKALQGELDRLLRSL